MSRLRPVAVFLQDYGSRHSHPVNAVLHIAGVPMVLYALYELLQGSFMSGLLLFILGYILQFLGHRAQGNEAGEVSLLKHIAARLSHARK